MSATWLKTRIFHRAYAGERICPEGDRIIQSYVRPLVERVAAEAPGHAFFFRRFSEGGSHVDVRFLADPGSTTTRIRAIIEETLPAFLSQHFPQPTAEVQFPPVGPDTYQRLWGDTPLHPAYTYDIATIEDSPPFDPLLTPMHQTAEDFLSRTCIEVLSALPTHQMRYQWALIASGMFIRESGLPAAILARFCERMSQRWYFLFGLDPAWEELFRERFDRVAERLRHWLSLEPADPELQAVLGPKGAALLGQVYIYGRQTIAGIAPDHRARLDPALTDLLAHNVIHMLNNRLNVSLQEELFSAYLLGRLQEEQAQLTP
jgi:hypothetical protein